MPTDKEVGPQGATPRDTDTETSHQTTGTSDSRAGLRRRRQAALRLPPVDCGCVDPWLCRCSRPPLSEKMIDAGADAAHHLLEIGFVPFLEPAVLRALHARAGDGRVLAEELYQLAGGDGV
jgi:hypothetical protein